MSDSTMVFEGKMSNGVNYQFHSTSSFSGRSELALIINEEPVAIWAIDVKKSGTVECRPLMSAKKMITKKEGECVPQEKRQAPSL